MNNFFRAIIAGYGAKKLGGGCFGTILVFVLIWVALGQCSFSSREVPPPETFPAAHRVCLPIDKHFESLTLAYVHVPALSKITASAIKTKTRLEPGLIPNTLKLINALSKTGERRFFL
jgi:hypothetical protein